MGTEGAQALITKAEVPTGSKQAQTRGWRNEGRFEGNHDSNELFPVTCILTFFKKRKKIPFY